MSSVGAVPKYSGKGTKQLFYAFQIVIMKVTSTVKTLGSFGLKNYMPIVFHSLPLGLATRTPEAAPGFYRNEIPAMRQRNQVHHLPGESENLFYEQRSYYLYNLF